MAISISLAPSGNITLHLPRHTCEVPLNAAGVALLKHVLMGESIKATKIGQQGNPTQWDIDRWLRSSEGAKALQLAGDRKRFADIKKATDVTVRRARQASLHLDIDLDF